MERVLARGRCRIHRLELLRNFRVVRIAQLFAAVSKALYALTEAFRPGTCAASFSKDDLRFRRAPQGFTLSAVLRAFSMDELWGMLKFFFLLPQRRHSNALKRYCCRLALRLDVRVSMQNHFL